MTPPPSADRAVGDPPLGVARSLPGNPMGWFAIALLLGALSLGLEWTNLGSAGYQSVARVPVLAAGLLAVAGWQRGSELLLRLAMAAGLAGLAIGRLAGPGPLVFAFALVALWVSARDSITPRWTGRGAGAVPDPSAHDAQGTAS